MVLSDVSTFRRDGWVRADERPIEVVVRFTDAFATGRLKALPDLLAPECVDANAAQGQSPGRAGVLAKCASFHARFAGFQLRLARVIDEGNGRVVADLATRFPSGEVLKWRGHFVVAAGVIARIEAEVVV
jgi:hypothetical protein